MQKKKRVRGRNFTEKEKQEAIAIIEKYSYIIENKACDSTTQQARKEAWEKVTEEFNAVTSDSQRNSKHLKILYGNLKRIEKKIVAADNKKRYLTDQAEEEAYKKQKLEDKRNMLMTDEDSNQSLLIETGSQILTMKETQAEPVANPYEPKNKIKKSRKTLAELKRLYYIRKIQLTNLEIKYKRNIYELELKLKKKLLNEKT